MTAGRRAAVGASVLALGLAVSAVASPARAHAQAPPDAPVRVDQVFAPWDSVTTPGCAVAVDRGGLTVLSEAYGMADLEFGVPNTPATIFEGGSLSKQITAATVILLALDGRLSVDDDVRAWVPEVPDYGPTIRLRHLMNHTSGLRDWGSVADLSGWGREERSHTHDDALRIIARQSALNFEPGHEYSYSNTGYTLLAIVAERVSGKPLRVLSDERIFEPVGMDHTQWRDDYRRLVPGRSAAYARRDDGAWAIDRPIEHVYGNGGLLTTVGDLLLWNRALADERFGPAFTRMMLDTGTLNDGSSIVYASGLRVEPFDGVPSITHTGATAGYRAFLGRYPDQELSVAMLCNAANVPTGSNGGQVARIYLGDAASEPEAPAPAAVAEATLRAYAGRYREPVTGEPMTWTFEDGALVLDGRTRLRPVSATSFATGPGDARFVVEAGGTGRPTVREEGWAYTERRFEPVDAWAPSPAELAPAVGTYHSRDAETTLSIRIDDTGAVLVREPATEVALEPIYPDAFDAGGWIVRLVRGPNGRVDGIRVSGARVYDMRFARVDP